MARMSLDLGHRTIDRRDRDAIDKFRYDPKIRLILEFAPVQSLDYGRVDYDEGVNAAVNCVCNLFIESMRVNWTIAFWRI